MRRFAGRAHADERRAHALVAGGARHLLHQLAARHLLRARQVRARRAGRRRLPGTALLKKKKVIQHVAQVANL